MDQDKKIQPAEPQNPPSRQAQSDQGKKQDSGQPPANPSPVNYGLDEDPFEDPFGDPFKGIRRD